MDAYVETILQVAERDVSIARVLRDICTLDETVRAGALDLMGAHLRSRSAAADVLECLQALRRQEVADHIARRLGATGQPSPAG